MSDKTDPWDEMVRLARRDAVRTNWRVNRRRCQFCRAESDPSAPFVHTPDCPVRPDRENPYAGLVEALSECVEHLLVERKAFVHSHAVPPAFNEASLEGFAAEELAEMDERIAKARDALAAAEGRS